MIVDAHCVAQTAGRTSYFFLGGERCGVAGRPLFIPLYWYLAFFSDGFRIWKFRRELLKKRRVVALHGSSMTSTLFRYSIQCSIIRNRKSCL